MGVNAQTAVPAFVAGEILTAAEMTQVNTGIPVFATTVTRDAAFGGTGEKVLAQGQYAYIEATSSLMVYSGSAWVTVGSALVRVGGGALSSNSTAFNNVFSSSYDAYKIVVSNGGISSSDYVRMILGATATGYVGGLSAVSAATSAYSNTFSTITTAFLVAYTTTVMADFGFEVTVVNPQLAKKTFVTSFGNFNTGNENGNMGGFLNNSTQYTGFTLSTSAASFSGTVNIYGYSLS